FSLGVTLRGSPVVTRGTKISLPQCQWIAHDPVLDQADQGVVDGRVTVGVVVPHHFADNAGRFVKGPFRAVTTVEHRVDDAAVDWFEAVTNIGQGTYHDHGHRVVEVGPLQLGLKVDLIYAGPFWLVGGWCLLVTHGVVISEFSSKSSLGVGCWVLRCRGIERLWRFPG